MFFKGTLSREQSPYKYNVTGVNWLCDKNARTAQGADPTPPLPLRAAKAGRNNLHEKNIPLFPTGKGERCSQTISNLCQAALLCHGNSPYKYTLLSTGIGERCGQTISNLCLAALLRPC
jgi:hypothetical protein